MEGKTNTGYLFSLVTLLEVANLPTVMVTICSIQSPRRTLQRGEQCNLITGNHRPVTVCVLCWHYVRVITRLVQFHLTDVSHILYNWFDPVFVPRVHLFE